MSEERRYFLFHYIATHNGMEHRIPLAFTKNGNPIEYGNERVKQKQWKSFRCYEMSVGKEVKE